MADGRADAGTRAADEQVVETAVTRTPPAAPRRGGRRRVVTVSAAVALAAVLVIVLWTTRGADAWVYDASTRNLVVDDDVVCGATTGAFFCLDPASGQQRFRVPVRGDYVPSLTLARETLLVGLSTELRAYTLDGEQRWTAPFDTSVGAPLLPPSVAGDGVVAALDRNAEEVVGLDVATGQELWRLAELEIRGSDDFYAVRARAVVANHYVHSDGQAFYMKRVAVDGCHITAIDPASGMERWRSAPLPGPVCPPVRAAVAFGHEQAVAFAVWDAPGRLLALDAATGSALWEAELSVSNQTSNRSLAAVGDVTVAIAGGRMRAYGRDGTELWSAPVEETVTAHNLDALHGLIVEDGVLYHVHGGVSVVDPRTGASETVIAHEWAEGSPVSDLKIVGNRMITARSAVEGLPFDR